MLTITSEHPSSEYNFEIKSQDNIFSSNQGFEKKIRIIDIVQGRTTNGTKKVIIITY